jgi:hypothetical protein
MVVVRRIFARLWTGFTQQSMRKNFEDINMFETNTIDPSAILADKHDYFPKRDLSGGYLGDGYPLCVSLPDQAFLRVGAKYIYRGAQPARWTGPSI